MLLEVTAPEYEALSISVSELKTVNSIYLHFFSIFFLFLNLRLELAVIRRECGQTLARVRVSQT